MKLPEVPHEKPVGQIIPSDHTRGEMVFLSNSQSRNNFNMWGIRQSNESKLSLEQKQTQLFLKDFKT